MSEIVDPVDLAGLRSLSRRQTLALLAFGLSLMIAGISSRWALTRHEVLTAEPAREMLASGKLADWIIPKMAGVPRLVKPPTTSWLIAASMAIFRSRSEFVVRLPSALSAAIVGWLTATLAARFYGRTVGMVAGLMQLTSVYLLMQARLAEADIMLAACAVGAMTVFALACVRGTTRPGDAASAAAGSAPGPSLESTSVAAPTTKSTSASAIAFYLCVAGAVLFKGPVGLLFTLPGCIVWASMFRSRRAARLLLNPLGLLAFVIVAGLPYFAAWRVYPPIAHVWFHETVDRATGAGDLQGGREPWFFYLWTIPWLALPWFPLIFAALLKRPPRETSDLGNASPAAPASPSGIDGPVAIDYFSSPPRDSSRFSPFAVFLFAWFLPGLLALSAVNWKHKHYVIPILPPLIIPAAIGLLRWLQRQYARPPKGYALATAGYLIACAIAAGFVLARSPRRGEAMAISLTIALLALGGTLTLWAELRRNLRLQLGAIFGTAWLAIAVAMLFIMPFHDDYRPSANFALNVNRQVPAGQRLLLLGIGEAHVTYYLTPRVVRADAPDDVAALVRSELDANNAGWRLPFRSAPQVQAITRVGFLPTLQASAMVSEVERCPLVSRSEGPGDQLVFVRLGHWQTSP